MEVDVGSGNVFADLGFPDAAELDIKVRLAVEIVKIINARRAFAGCRCGAAEDQPP